MNLLLLILPMSQTQCWPARLVVFISSGFWVSDFILDYFHVTLTSMRVIQSQWLTGHLDSVIGTLKTVESAY